MCNEAYAAGLIDGEATVYLKKSTYRSRSEKWKDCINPQYQPVIKVKMVNKAALEFLKNMFGGSFYQEKRAYPSHNGFNTSKILWSWSVSDKNAIRVCEAILPYSIVKKENLQNLIDLYYLKKKAALKRKSDGKFHGQPYSQEWIVEFEKYYTRSKELNA